MFRKTDGGVDGGEAGGGGGVGWTIAMIEREGDREREGGRLAHRCE